MTDRYGQHDLRSSLRFLISWEWLGYLVVVVLFAIATWGLSQWQFARRDEAVREAKIITQNYHAAPVSLDSITGDGKPLSEHNKYRSVKLVGTYETQHTLAVRNRPFSGNAGFEVIVIFRLEDGRRIVIDRGWIPVGKNASVPSTIPAAPTGKVTVIARLKQFEPTLGRTAPAGQLPTISLSPIKRAVGPANIVTTGYGIVASETPAPATVPQLIPRPEIDEGPHLSYALQWIGFGIMAFLGLLWAINRTRQKVEAADGDIQAAKAPAAPQRRKRDADELYEDEALAESER